MQQQTCTHHVQPEQSPNGLTQFSYTYGEDVIYVQANVEDIILIHPGTYFDPPEYGNALCSGQILWDNPITPENAPSLKELEEMLTLGLLCDWEVVQEEDYI